MSPEVKHDTEAKRFVVAVDGHDVFTQYRDVDADTVDFVSTFTPPELRGRGLARVVVEAGLAWARAQGREIQGSCWYVAKVLGEEANA
ncbi:MAG: N-acetyltransferase [Gemmatimonadetes bacterium]|nr:N-acetyltransferase [Gemmatimonadota bacterium]